MSLTPLAILKSNSLSNAVQAEIFQLFLRGEFAMGEKLSEAALAERLGVSRGPVREALRALEEAGLVTLTKNRGAFVREFSREDIRDLYELRIGLDRIIGSILAPRMSDASIDELRGRIARMGESLAENRLADYFPQNIAFHDRIAEMTGNSKLLQLYRRITNEMHLMRRHSIESGGGRLLSNEEHGAIVDALATRDRVLAARVLGEHGSAGYQRLRESWERDPARPRPAAPENPGRA